MPRDSGHGGAQLSVCPVRWTYTAHVWPSVCALHLRIALCKCWCCGSESRGAMRHFCGVWIDRDESALVARRSPFLSPREQRTREIRGLALGTSGWRSFYCQPSLTGEKGIALLALINYKKRTARVAARPESPPDPSRRQTDGPLPEERGHVPDPPSLDRTGACLLFAPRPSETALNTVTRVRLSRSQRQQLVVVALGTVVL